MSEAARKFEDVSARATLELLQMLMRDFHPRDFDIVLWDGTYWPPEQGKFRRFTWKIHNPDALRDVLSSTNRELALAEGYVSGSFDISGDIEAVFRLKDYLVNKQWGSSDKVRLFRDLVRLSVRSLPESSAGVPLTGPQHSLERDRKAIHYHYDLSNEFFALWLDTHMIYSCAYFERRDQDIDTAQVMKLDQICRKLSLQPGERLLDIGCGWGGLTIHAAAHYNARVLGITLSRSQFDFARERVREAGLADRCEVRLLDYRQLNDSEVFDKIASIGMVEHVGEKNLPRYFEKAFQLLRPGGAFLNSGIAKAGNRIESSEPTFTDRYVFPDGELETIGSLVTRAEQAGFELEDVENLRKHYYLTTLSWLHRLEAHAREAQQIVGERKYRVWRLYLAGSAHYFHKGLLDLYQTLLVKAHNGEEHRLG